MSQCMICGQSGPNTDRICPVCGFRANLPAFLSAAHYRQWTEQCVLPYRKQWVEIQINEQRRKSAEERANQLLQEAERIKADAQKEAECILQETRLESEQLKENTQKELESLLRKSRDQLKEEPEEQIRRGPIFIHVICLILIAILIARSTDFLPNILSEFSTLWATKKEYDEEGNHLEYNAANQVTKTTYSPPRYYSNYFSSYSSWLGWCTYDYDIVGHLTTETFYKKEGSVYSHNEYEYDDEGNCTKVSAYDAAEKLKSWSAWEYSDDNGDQIAIRRNYDAEGNLSSWSESRSGSSVTSCSTYNSDNTEISYEEYDNDGKLQSVVHSDANGDFSNRIVYEYYNNGQLSREIRYLAGGVVEYTLEYDTDGRPSKKIYSESTWKEYAYDEDGYLVTCTSYDESGNVTGWIAYEYDTDKNRTKRTCFNLDGTVNGWYTYEYTSNGNRAKKIKYNANGEAVQWIKYSRKGTPTKKCYDADGLIYTVEYQYDAEGNGTYTAFDPDGNAYGDSVDSD